MAGDKTTLEPGTEMMSRMLDALGLKNQTSHIRGFDLHCRPGEMIFVSFNYVPDPQQLNKMVRVVQEYEIGVMKKRARPDKPRLIIPGENGAAQ